MIDPDWTTADESRKWFFATLRDTVWPNVSDEDRKRWPSVEHLRKSALINIGHCEVNSVVVGSNEAAKATAAIMFGLDRYCVVDIQGDVMMVFTARSMRRGAVPTKAGFLEVALAAFDWIYEQTGIAFERGAPQI